MDKDWIVWCRDTEFKTRWHAIEIGKTQEEAEKYAFRGENDSVKYGTNLNYLPLSKGTNPNSLTGY